MMFRSCPITLLKLTCIQNKKHFIDNLFIERTEITSFLTNLQVNAPDVKWTILDDDDEGNYIIPK